MSREIVGLAITVNTDITFINQTNTRKVHTACANILALPEAPVSGAFLLPEEGCILNKKRTAAIIVAAILGLASLLYLGGVLGQLQENYEIWIASGGITGQAYIQPVNWMPGVCFRKACSIQGIKSIGILLLVGAAIILYLRFHDKFGSKDHDERGFSRSKYGTYGTAAWMADKEMKEILEIKPPERADGIILGEKNGNVVCLPKDTRLNRHIAVFGASGTRKSRGVIRPALFTILKRGESAVITDPKAELYNDTSELFRKNGYEVKVFNLVDPRHSDSCNCMSDLGGDTLLAQVLTNVIISNTSEGKGDHFWDNGEANLLKALVLYIDLDRSRATETKNLAAAYQLLTQNSERQLTALFEKLPLDHPARAPFNLFSQASDTVRSGIVLGLGTRLQVLQNESVRNIISHSDIDLTAPGKRKCVYYVILSDQDATMAFLSSLFFSFLFIKLVRYADLPQLSLAGFKVSCYNNN